MKTREELNHEAHKEHEVKNKLILKSLWSSWFNSFSFERYYPVIILIFALPLFYYKLGALGLVGPDEPRYAQVAREMFERNDWITPTLLGDTWFEKPTLLYWLTIGCYHLLGVDEWAARLPNALLATLNLFIIYYVAKRAGGRRYGLLSAIVLATSGLYFGLARAASFDIPLTLTFTAALSFFHLADTSENSTARRKYLIGFYAMLGLSLLAKGLVGIVLMGAIIGLYIIFTGQLRKIFCFHPFAGLLICLLVAGLWYGPVIARHGWPFIEEFFIQHHFQRYTSNKYHHPGPIYFFIAIILAGVAPWSIFLIASGIDALRNLLPIRERIVSLLHSTTKQDRLLLLSGIWLLVPLAFFSFSNSKLPGYILPVFPALALFIAREIEKMLANSPINDVRLIVSAVFLFILGLALAFFAGKELQTNLTGRLILGGIPIIAAGAIFCWRRRGWLAVAILACMNPLLAIAIASLLFPAIENKASLAPLARVAAQALQPNEKLIFYNDVEYAPFFYTNGRILPGEKGEAARADNTDELARYLAPYQSLLCIVRQRQLNLITEDARFDCTQISSQRTFVLLRVSLKSLTTKSTKLKNS